MSAQTPVWRQLYTEKQVVAEERRTRTDNAPMGRFQVRLPFLRVLCSEPRLFIEWFG